MHSLAYRDPSFGHFLDRSPFIGYVTLFWDKLPDVGKWGMKCPYSVTVRKKS